MRIHLLHSVLAVLVVSLIFPTQIWANPLGAEIGMRGNEYISGDEPKSVLVQVTAIGAIGKSGVHYIPVNTDLITFIALAGGLSGSHDEELRLKRVIKGKPTIFKINVNRLLEEGDKVPILKNGDVLHIPFVKESGMDTFLQTLTIVSTILSLTLTAIVLGDRL